MVQSIKSTSWFLFLSGLILVSGCRQPEPQKPDPVRRKSPIAIAKITHDPSDTYVKIVYGQPYRRDRQVFGNIIPYGQVWRTGANEATELTTTKDIILGGKKLPAGTYTMFSIPRKDDDWTIILNGELGQWGAFEYDQSQDVLRIDVQARQKQPITEALNIQFSGIENNSTNIVLRWDQTVVRIPIEFINSHSASS